MCERGRAKGQTKRDGNIIIKLTLKWRSKRDHKNEINVLTTCQTHHTHSLTNTHSLTPPSSGSLPSSLVTSSRHVLSDKTQRNKINSNKSINTTTGNENDDDSLPPASLFPYSTLFALFAHARTQAPPRAKRGVRGRGGQLHVSAHFTAQAFSLNKMLSGGEKGRRTKGLAKGEQGGKGRAREGRMRRQRATDKLSAKQSRSRGRVVKLYLQHKQSCRQGSNDGSSDADANANDEGEGEREEEK